MGIKRGKSEPNRILPTTVYKEREIVTFNDVMILPNLALNIWKDKLS